MTRLSWTGIFGNIITFFGGIIFAIIFWMLMTAQGHWYWIVLFIGTFISLFFTSIFISTGRCKIISGLLGLFYGGLIGGLLILISEEKRISNIKRN